MTAAGFNRRIRKTVRTVVWEGDRAQSRSLDLIFLSRTLSEQYWAEAPRRLLVI